MKTIARAYRTELRPTLEQVQLLSQTCSAVRYIYNAALEQRSMLYRQWGKRISAFDQMKELTVALADPEFAWLRRVSRTALNAAIQNLDRGFEAFFRRVKAGQTPGYPRYKSRRRNEGAFKILVYANVVNGRIWVPKIGWVRLKEKGYLPNGTTRILTGAVKERAGRWFVSISVSESVEHIAAEGPALGLDVGARSLATLSDGTTYDNPQSYFVHQKKLRRLQRKLGRQKKGSGNWGKTKAAIARLHFKIVNIREDALHKISHDVTAIRQPSRLVIEDLNITRMARRSIGVGKILHDASMGELLRQLEYKADWYGTELVKAHRFYASSKTCSQCGERNASLAAKKIFLCPSCGFTEDRDVNAAKNLLRYIKPTGTGRHSETAARESGKASGETRIRARRQARRSGSEKEESQANAGSKSTRIDRPE